MEEKTKIKNIQISGKQAIFILLTGMAFVDNEFHEVEKKFLKNYKGKEKLANSFFDKTISDFKKSKNPQKIVNDCLSLINTKELQEKALKLLEKLCESDNVLAPSETSLLSEIKNQWGMESKEIQDIKLDKKQKEIAEYDSTKFLVVNAGPGTGKTAILSARVGFSFTRSAVKEMRDRVDYFATKSGRSAGIILVL